MNVSEAISTRRAIRSYTTQAVDEDTVEGLLHAAVQAPSAMNAQPWIFSVIQDPKQLARWSARAKALTLAKSARDPKSSHYAGLLGDPQFNIFYDATTLIVIGAREPGPYAQADGWLAAQNLMLAAVEAGLGTCPIGFALPFLETPEAKAEMAFPENGVVVAALIVGYPKATPAAVARNPPHVVSWR